MSLYSKYVLPRLIDASCRNTDISKLRQLVLPAAKGTVLEVGIGSALNLPYYSLEVVHLCAVEPSPDPLLTRDLELMSGNPTY